MASSSECVVLVTGGSGFLGQHLIGLLQTRAKHVTEIRVLDLPSNPYINKLDYEASKPVKQYLGNINDVHVLHEACQGVHCVMHLAGLIDVSMFPDTEQLELVNVTGTSLLLNTCRKLGVKRFLYCSTMDVVCSNCDIIDGTEFSTAIPEVFFFDGYAFTKYKAEKMVLANNCDGFKTLSIRPTTMYGEEDKFTVTEPLKMARKIGRWVRFDCKKAVHQMTYAGNVAWAFICAEKALIDSEQNTIGGQVYFVTDDTPLTDIFEFQDPFAKACGFRTDTFKIPTCIVLYFMYLVYAIMWVISFIVPVNSRLGLCTFKYMKRTFTYKSVAARMMFNYEPLYSFDESMRRSTQFYVKHFHR